jgi:hypothetical protein
VDGGARRDSGCDQRLVHAVQIVQGALHRRDARRALGHWQRVIGHALDLAHDERKHPVGKQRGQQRQRITGVLGDVPGPGRRLGTLRRVIAALPTAARA